MTFADFKPGAQPLPITFIEVDNYSTTVFRITIFADNPDWKNQGDAINRFIQIKVPIHAVAIAGEFSLDQPKPEKRPAFTKNVYPSCTTYVAY